MIKALLEVNLRLSSCWSSSQTFTQYYYMCFTDGETEAEGGDSLKSRWMTGLGIESGSPGSQHCYQLTGLCNRITLSLQLGQSKHREVKGLGLMRTECPKLWLKLMELLNMQYAENSTLCIVGKFFHRVRMSPVQSHRLLRSASGVAPMVLRRRAVAAGS